MKTVEYLACFFCVAAILGCGEHHDAHMDTASLSPSSSFTGVDAPVVRNGQAVVLEGKRLAVGDAAPDVLLYDDQLRSVKLSAMRGHVVLLSSVPSLDTPVCNNQALKLDQMAADAGDGVMMACVSMDLPSAQKRWREQHAAHDLRILSDYRDRQFGHAYGLLMADSQWLARSVLVIDQQGIIRYIEVVGDLGREPDYEAAMAVVKQLTERNQ